MKKQTLNNQLVYIRCNCGHETLVVEYDTEVKTYDLAMYSYGLTAGKTPLMHRIAMAARLIFKGTLWHDSICLDQKGAGKLAKFLAAKK